MPLPNPLCLLLGHRRSRGRARQEADGWHSSCRHCRAPMLRDRSGRWQCEPAGDSPRPLPTDG